MKKIGILGSTGSIGKQALDVVKQHPNKFTLIFISAKSNVDLLIKQANEFNPKYVCIYDEAKIKSLKDNVKNSKILYGKNGLLELCSNKESDIILNAIIGYQGLEPTLKVISSGIDIALSNKESIVQAGHLVMDEAKKSKVNIFPVDSEHSALWQCMIGENKKFIKKIILTASGGPFRNLSLEKFKNITKKQALNHPNWIMGDKITIDSATMMNKGFELIEAYWLFNIPLEKIKIVIHPQSIIHSMIEFQDGSIKAQLSEPDMRSPIQYALSFPERYHLKDLNFNIERINNLTFENVDTEKFKCIKFAKQAIQEGGTMPTVLNVANDIFVGLFLKEKISFNDIIAGIEKTMHSHNKINRPDLDQINMTTEWTENFIKRNFIK